MDNKKYILDARLFVSVVIYVAMVLALFVPLGFIDPDFLPIKYPVIAGQEFYIFNEGFHFEPFIELIFISLISILVAIVIFGALKVKSRAIIVLVAIISIYMPLSFLLNLIPYFLDYISDSIQAAIRSIICERHHTGIVSTSKNYLYDCPLGGYVGVFIVINNFFVLINLTILSAMSGFIFVIISSLFQNDKDYVTVHKYVYFCLPIFAGYLPLIFIMAIGRFFDLYIYIIYQGLVIFAFIVSFIPVIIHFCNETNVKEIIKLDIKKTCFVMAVLFFTITACGLIYVVTFIFNYDILYIFLLVGRVDYHLLFASFYVFFVVIMTLQIFSFNADDFSLSDMSLVVFVSIILGAAFTFFILDIVIDEHYLWQSQASLIGRQIYENCISLSGKGICPYLPY